VPVEEPPDSGSTGPAPDRTGPRRKRSLLIGVAIAAVLAVVLFVGLQPTATTSTGQPAAVGVGSIAPDFTLPNLLSTPASPLPPVHLDALGRDRHRPVVLNFFASWCIPCRAETPLLASTARSLRAQGSPVQFVGVDVADQASAAIPFVEQAGIDYPVGADTTLRVTSVLYGLNGQPNTFFINESGVVIGHHLGALTQAELTGWLHRLAGAAG